MTKLLILIITSRFTKLQSLDIDCGVITSSLYESITRLPNLKTLKLNTSQWGATPNLDRNIKKLVDSKSLKYLIINELSLETIQFFEDHGIMCKISPAKKEYKFYKFNFNFKERPKMVLEMNYLNKVDNIKAAIEDLIDVPSLTLIFAGKYLEDDRTLCAYNVQFESNLHVIEKSQ